MRLASKLLPSLLNFSSPALHGIISTSMAPITKINQRIYARNDMQAEDVNHAPMLFMVQLVIIFHNVDPINGQGGAPGLVAREVRSRRDSLGFADVSTKFLLPLDAAAKELNISRSTLQFRCRELGIHKWPYRKLKSLQNLIETVVAFGRPGYEDVVVDLKQELEAIMHNPSREIKAETDLLRREMCDQVKIKRRRFSRQSAM